MKYAGFWRRTGSLLVDALVVMSLFFVYFYIVMHFRSLGIVCVLVTAFLSQMYPIYFHKRWGQTIGKMAVGIVVRDMSGGPVSWKQAFLRSSVDLAFGILGTIGTVIALSRMPEAMYQASSLSNWLKAVGECKPHYMDCLRNLNNYWYWSELIVLLFNETKRALHDFIAGTVVVHKSPQDASASWFA